MRKDITVGTGKGAVAKPTHVDPGQGTDIGGVAFAGRALSYDDDIPSKFRIGAKKQTALAAHERPSGPSADLVLANTAVAPKSDREIKKIAKASIASGVRQLEKPRKSMGRIVQRRIGWNATPVQIIVTTAERELARRGDGRLAPSGVWLIEHRQTFTNTSGTAEKRTGRVSVSGAGSARPGASGAGSAPVSAPSSDASTAESFPEGQFALSLLPAEVRSSAISRVPTPTLFDGSVVLYSDAATGVEDHKEVNVIRMDTHRAVVIQATLHPNAREWEVAQATYTLSAPEIEQV